MKRILTLIIATILGSLTTGLTILIAVAAVAITGYYLHSFSIFFIFPIGALFSGAASTMGFYWTYYIANRKPVGFDFLISLFLSVISFFGIYYVLYSVTYVSDDMKINYDFQGEHISNFVYKSGNNVPIEKKRLKVKAEAKKVFIKEGFTEKEINDELTDDAIVEEIYDSITGIPMTFKNFLIDDIGNRKASFIIGRKKVAVPIGSVSLGSTINWIDFIIEGLGFIIGSFFGFYFKKDENGREQCLDT